MLNLERIFLTAHQITKTPPQKHIQGEDCKYVCAVFVIHFILIPFHVAYLKELKYFTCAAGLCTEARHKWVLTIQNAMLVLSVAVDLDVFCAQVGGGIKGEDLF